MTDQDLSRHPEIRKVLIVGPNGNMESHLIPELLALGYEVRALQSRSPVEPRPGPEVVEGHTLDPASLEPLEAGHDPSGHHLGQPSRMALRGLLSPGDQSNVGGLMSPELRRVSVESDRCCVEKDSGQRRDPPVRPLCRLTGLTRRP